MAHYPPKRHSTDQKITPVLFSGYQSTSYMNFQNHVGLDNLRCVVILPFLYNSMVKGGWWQRRRISGHRRDITYAGEFERK